MNGVRTDIHKHMCTNQRQVKFSEDRTITEFMAIILVFYFIEYHVHCFLTRFASYWSSSNDDYAKINAYLKRRCSREMKKKKKRKNMNKRLINKFMNENKMCAIRRTRKTWNENEIGMYAWIASEKRDRRRVWASECAWYRETETERDCVVI